MDTMLILELQEIHLVLEQRMKRPSVHGLNG